MELIECEIPVADGYCADNECHCAPQRLAPGQGFLFISQEVVAFRRDCPTRAQLLEKLAPISQRGEYISPTTYEPILVCEEAAQARNLDLAIAAADAQQWWKQGNAPLRPTPTAPSSGAVPEPQPNTPEMMPLSASCNQPDSSAGESATPKNSAGGREWSVSELDSSSKPASNAPGTAAVSDSSTPRQLASSAAASDEQEISADQAASRLADGPLAEFAARMSKALNPPDKVSYEQSISATSTSVSNIAYQPEHDAPAIAPVAEKKRNRHTVGKIILISAAATLLIVLTGMIVFTMLHPLDKTTTTDSEVEKVGMADEAFDDLVVPGQVEESLPDQIPPQEPVISQSGAVLPPPDQLMADAAQNNEVPQSPNQQQSIEPQSGPGTESIAAFFERPYAFRDGRYHGFITFSGISSGRGTYEQRVRISGKDKEYTVTGALSFSGSEIHFSPQGSETSIVWRMESWDRESGSAVFYDPKNEDPLAGKVRLTAKE